MQSQARSHGKMDLALAPPPLARRPPIRARTSLGLCLAISAFVHLAIAWRMTFGLPSIPTRGEDGHEGAGGATFEVSVEGEAAPTPHPAIGIPTEPPPSPPIALAPNPRSTPTSPAPAPSPSPSTATAPSTAPSSTSPSTADPSPSDPSPTAIAAAGTGADATSSGRMSGRDDARLRAILGGAIGGAPGGSALGDVAILEAASRCPDPVAGTWTAHRYSPEFRDWARFTLRITRDGDRLTGTIRTRMWRGLPSDTRPPSACTPDGWDYTVEMTAHGSVRGDTFDFGAREHHIARVDCPSPVFGYNPDHFSGHWDVERDQLQTVNNDGGRDVDAAYTFRRSSCQP